MQTLQRRRLAVSRAHAALGPDPAGSRYGLMASLEGKLYPEDERQKVVNF